MLNDVVGVAYVFARLDDRFELRLAIHERTAHQIKAVEIEQVKDVVRHSSACGKSGNLCLVLSSEPRLQQLKSRDAMFIKGNYLTVENRSYSADALSDVRQLRVMLGRFVFVTRDIAGRADV